MTAIRSHAIASILTDPNASTVKRLAWAYGCALKGSEIEAKLLAVLIARIKRMP